MPKKILFLSFCVALFLLIPHVTFAALTQCDASTPCPAGQYCQPASGTCTTKIANNGTCDTPESCASGSCVNDLCVAAAPGGAPTAPGAAAAAAGGAPAKSYDLPNFLNTTEPADVIGRVIKAIIGVSGIIALIMFIYGGVLWLISAGREAYVDKGRDTMLWSAVGLAVVFGSYILVNFVFTFFGQ